jgi:hypothetical protein
VLILCYGTVVHVVQLAAADLRPYPWAPTWLAAYFVSLTVLDPLAALLLWLRRRAGLLLAIGVLVTDAAANGYAAYGLSEGGGAARVGQAVVTTLAVVAVVTAPRVRRWLPRSGAPPHTGRTMGSEERT